jgi:hypothetical protein
LGRLIYNSEFSVIFVPESAKKEAEEDKNEEPVPSIGILEVYRYADNLDYVFLAIGILLCLAQVSIMYDIS